MKQSMPLVVLMLAVLASGVGCANTKVAAQDPAFNESVTDVDVPPMLPGGPGTAFTAPPVLAPPAAAAALVAEAPHVTETPAPPAAGGAYTVKKGDTLFGIARQFYGHGGRWQRIAGANPGLSAATLQAGTTIAVP